MREKLKSAGKLVLQGVVWVFVLSIQVDGRTLFSHAHGILVDNQVVAAVESQVTKGLRAASDLASSQARRIFGQESGRRG
ncbi:MAG: hypothetical protein RIQ81_1752 [Pseudomonadota bacterium]|jgi:hypothetical protein